MRRRALLWLLGAAPLIRSGRAADGVELLMFETESCPYCKQWHSEIGPIYPKTEEGRIAPLRRVDLHAPRPPDLETVDAIVYTPTFVLMRDGREVGRIAGYPGEDFFWPMLAELLEQLGEHHIRS